MDIDTTSLCNFLYVRCYLREVLRPKRLMELEIYKKIFYEIAGKTPDTEIWPIFYDKILILKECV